MRELIGTALAIFIAVVALSFAAPALYRTQQIEWDAPLAYQLQNFGAGVEQYATANFSVLAAAAVGGNVLLDAPTLIAANSLDPSFATTNRYGGTIKAIVHAVSPTQLEILGVFCGSRTIADPAARRIAQLASSAGVNSLMLLSSNLTNAIGATGGMLYPLAQFAGTSCTITSGNVGFAIYLDGAQVIPPYLFRYPVPGAGNGPNTMYTTQYMNNNNIMNVNDIYSTGTGNWLSQAVSYLSVQPPGNSIPFNTCPQGTPQIAVIPVAYSDNGVGLPIIRPEGYATLNADGVSWTTHLDVWTQDPTDNNGPTQVPVNATYGRVAVLLDCS